MSSFVCEYCGTFLIDSGPRYTTECEHYPNKPMTPAQYEEHKTWLKTLKTIEERNK